MASKPGKTGRSSEGENTTNPKYTPLATSSKMAQGGQLTDSRLKTVTRKSQEVKTPPIRCDEETFLEKIM